MKKFCDLKVGDTLFIFENKEIKEIFFKEIQQSQYYWIITNKNKICLDKEDLESDFIVLRDGTIATSIDRLLLETTD